MNQRLALAAVMLFCASAPIAGAQEHRTEVQDLPSGSPREQIIRTLGQQQPGYAAKASIQLQPAAPDLLKEALSRPAMNLSDFEQLALANNPTLQQADAITRRSAGLARQVGCFRIRLPAMRAKRFVAGRMEAASKAPLYNRPFLWAGSSACAVKCSTNRSAKMRLALPCSGIAC
jgi:hypothetical protein